MSIDKKDLVKVVELERKHVEVYIELLKAVDELYLIKQEKHDIELSSNEINMLEMRNQMRLSMDKSIAVLKAIDRLNNVEKNGQNIEDIDSVEDKLALNLRNQLDKGIEIDAKVNTTMNETSDLVASLQKETIKYNNLTKRLQELQAARERNSGSSQEYNHDISDGDKQLTDSDNRLDDETRLTNENEVLKQLLIALKVHTRSA